MAVALAGCSSSPPGSCSSSLCTSGIGAGQYVTTCARPDGTLAYQFGGSTCTCPLGSTNDCGCGRQVLDWCGDSAGDLSVGGLDLSVVPPDLANPHPCSVTFTGGISWTDTCYGTIDWNVSINQWHFLGGSGYVGTTGYEWSGAIMDLRGPPQPGSWNHTQVLDSTSFIVMMSGAHPSDPDWQESAFSAIGSLTLTLTSLGASVSDGNGGQYYGDAHGSVAATLIQSNSSVTAPNVQMMMTF
jgi:hypothetical protein